MWQSGGIGFPIVRPCKCVDTTPEMAWPPAALRSWPVGPEVLEQSQAMPELQSSNDRLCNYTAGGFPE